MTKEKKNKLSIHLIKSDTAVDEIIVQDPSLMNHKIDGSVLYVKPSSTKRPGWINSFFGSALVSEKDIFSSVPSAVQIIPVKVAPKTLRHFAVTFGAGYHLLRKGVSEEHFGLRVVLNAVDQKNIRAIDKTSLGALVKQTREQAGRSAETSEFGINIEQDLIQAVTGLSVEKELGKTISGKDSLHVSVLNTSRNIVTLLKLCFRYYSSVEYKKKFPWIDQIEEIREAKKIVDLNTKLEGKINEEKFEKLWMAVPEIIDWNDFDCFKYRGGDKARHYRDLMIPDFIEEHREYKNKFTIELLKRFDAYCFFETSPEKSWRIYDCIYAEISEQDRIYTLTNGKWYQVNKDFSEDIEREFLRILSHKSPLMIPKCPARIENNTEPIVESRYNEYAAKKCNYALLDRKTIMHSGSPIEVCDLYGKNGEFIHIKHYGGSSVLSHLFNQGIVSAELFASHASFRKEMNKKLPAEFRVKNPAQPINPPGYKIAFGIISSSKKDLDIPFFSKVALRNCFLRLNLYRFNVYLHKVDIDSKVQL